VSKRKKARQAEVRDGAQRVEVYNEGLFIFLYDEARTEELKAAEAAEVVTGGDNVEDGDRRRRALGKAGALVVYELYQDDPEVLEVAVGPPLSAAEMKKMPFVKPQQALLSLPSGRLRIESWDSLSISDDGGDEKGGRLQVPPGDYMLTLHRVDFWSEVEHPISGVITLTPVGSLAAAKKLSPIVPVPDSFANRKKKASIKDGTFHGVIVEGRGEWITNLTPDLIDKLGWRWGERLRVETDRWHKEAVFLGCTTLAYAEKWLGTVGCAVWPKRAALHSHPEAGDHPGSWTLAFARFHEKEELPTGPAGCRVTITAVPPPLVGPLDNSLLGKSDVKDGALHCFVLAASDQMIVLSFPWKALLRWGYKPGDPLVFRFDGVERVGYLRRSDVARKVAAGLVDSIPEYRKLAREFDKLMEARADVAWISPEAEALKLKMRAVKDQMENVALPVALRPSLPLTFDNFPHCEQRGVEILALEPIFGATHFLDIAAGSPVVVTTHKKTRPAKRR
jgi:hypothetical protein